MCRTRGFTFIELLVVIAVIALMMSILFPVFSQDREMARQTACVSNLRQIGMGYMLYVQDYDEQFPLAVQAPDRRLSVYWSPPNLVPWSRNDPTFQAMYAGMGANAIYNYTGSWAIWACPSSVPAWQFPDHPEWYQQFTPGVTPTQISYQFNGLLGALNLTDIPHVSMVPMVWEGPENRRFLGSNINNPGVKFWELTHSEDFVKLPTPESGWPFRQARCGTGLLGTMTTSMGTVASMEIHHGGQNWLYVDGHVRWRKLGGKDSRDPWQDPFIYNEDGTIRIYWGDACDRPWLFRPDFEPQDYGVTEAPRL